MSALQQRGIPTDLTIMRPGGPAWQWKQCLAGEEPAEILSARDREDLVYVLVHELGWTDREVAAHTRMTDYTAARIRDRLGLKPNQLDDNTAAA